METDDPLWRAIVAAHVRLSPARLDKFPPAPGWELSPAPLGSANDQGIQALNGPVPTGPTVPTLNSEGDDEAINAARLEWEERAAIREFDGRQPRAEAEDGASADLF
ncbi:MAG: hypothetical protein JWO33_472 [Caulobacteraceae bacterium]|nr:hypothetical protein [Caulobacteraceae bacterium]